MKFFLSWTFAWTLGFFAFQETLSAQNTDSLEKWFERSWEYSPEIKTSKAQVEVADALSLSADSGFYPSLSTRYDFRESEQTKQSKVLSLVAEQNLFRGFGDYYDRKEANYLLDAEKSKFQIKKLSVAKSVAESLLKLASTASQKKIYDENAKILDKRLVEFRRRTRIGRSRDVDLLQNQIDRLQLDRARSVNFEKALSLTSTLKELSGVEVKEAPFELENILKQIHRYHQTLDQKLSQKEELKLKVSAQEAAVKSAHSTYWPRVNALATYYPANDSSFSQFNDDWSVGVNLEWTFFEGFAGKAKINQERALQRVAEAQLSRFDDGDAGLKQRLKSEWDRLAAERKLIIQAEELSSKAFKAQERDFRLGLITVLELSNSDEQYLTLKLERISVAEKLGLILTQAIERGGVEGLSL